MEQAGTEARSRPRDPRLHLDMAPLFLSLSRPLLCVFTLRYPLRIVPRIVAMESNRGLELRMGQKAPQGGAKDSGFKSP